MDKYVFHSYFHVIDMDGVDIILGCNQWYSNINVAKKCMKLWFKKNKIALQGISLTKQEEHEVAHE
jgi:hypothetical protein